MRTARLLTYPIVSDGGLPNTPLDADPLMQTLLDADPPPDADLPGRPPPPGRQNPHADKPPHGQKEWHACENITFPQLLLRAVKMFLNWVS